MQAIMDNIRILLPFAAFFWLWLLISVWRKPQRFRNSLLLMVTAGVTMMLIAGLFGDHMVEALLVMFFLVMAALLLVPVLLIANGVQMIRREGTSLANILSLLLGIAVGIGEIATVISVLGMGERTDFSDVYTIMALVGSTVFYFSFLILGFVLYTLLIQIMPHRMNFDYVIIHGCGLLRGREVSKLLADRLDKAIRVYEKCGQKPMMIPSGGKGSDEELAEAEAMTAYLLSHGIPAEQIIQEDQSTTTMENLICSRKIIESRPGEQKTALISSNYHVYRCLNYAHSIKMKCTGIGAHVAWYYWPSALIREFVAVFSKPGNLVFIFAGYLATVLFPAIQLLTK